MQIAKFLPSHKTNQQSKNKFEKCYQRQVAVPINLSYKMMDDGFISKSKQNKLDSGKS